LASSNRNAAPEETVEDIELKTSQPPISANDQIESANKLLASIGALRQSIARLALPVWLLLMVAVAALWSNYK
jgi:hypothetical protein